MADAPTNSSGVTWNTTDPVTLTQMQTLDAAKVNATGGQAVGLQVTDGALKGTDATAASVTTGGAATTVGEKLNNLLFASDFEIGSGGDDTARLTAALAAANTAGVPLRFVNMTVTLTADLTAPAGSYVSIGRSVTFSGGRLLGVTAQYDFYQSGSMGADYTKSTPRIGRLHTLGDAYGIAAWQRQWSANASTWQYSDYEHVFYREWAPNSQSTGGWPQATLAAMAVSMPGNTDFPAAFHAIGMVAGNGGSIWGANIIVGNGQTTTTPLASTVRWICGLEIDFQPSVGTTLSDSGAGLLLNAFWSATNAAALTLEADGGGSWGNGIYLAGISASGTGVLVPGGASMGTGIDLSAGAFSASAIAVPSNGNVLFKNASGGSGAILNTDAGGDLFILNQSGAAKIRSQNNTEGTQIASLESADGTKAALTVQMVGGATAATSACAMSVRANSTTSRSINAGGTINASGADYAEYEWKADGCGTISCGDIAGFDKDGRLTQVFGDAISFCVKSTSPNLVGGDNWHTALGERPVQPVLTITAEWTGGTRPVPSRQSADRAWTGGVRPAAAGAAQDAWDAAWTAYQQQTAAALQARQAAWDTARAAYTAQVAAEIAAYQSGPLADWQKAVTAYDASLETLRATVDRVAYCGKVPVNVTGASVGDYIIATANGTAIIGVAKSYASSTQEERDLFCVGRVRAILPDGRAEIVVKPI